MQERAWTRKPFAHTAHSGNWTPESLVQGEVINHYTTRSPFPVPWIGPCFISSYQGCLQFRLAIWPKYRSLLFLTISQREIWIPTPYPYTYYMHYYLPKLTKHRYLIWSESTISDPLRNEKQDQTWRWTNNNTLRWRCQGNWFNCEGRSNTICKSPNIVTRSREMSHLSTNLNS